MFPLVPAPHSSPDAENLHQSQRETEKGSDFEMRLTGGFRTHVLQFWRSFLKPTPQLHPKTAAHMSMEGVLKAPSSWRTSRRCLWDGGAA